MGSTGIRFTEDQLRRCERKSAELGISRNEFIRDAVDFYLEWLNIESTDKFLTPALESVISAKLRDVEYRISQNLFRMAVEQNLLAQVLICDGKYTRESIYDFHEKAVSMVEKNGTFCPSDMVTADDETDDSEEVIEEDSEEDEAEDEWQD
jgi:hypothetical protein